MRKRERPLYLQTGRLRLLSIHRSDPTGTTHWQIQEDPAKEAVRASQRSDHRSGSGRYIWELLRQSRALRELTPAHEPPASEAVHPHMAVIVLGGTILGEGLRKGTRQGAGRPSGGGQRWQGHGHQISAHGPREHDRLRHQGYLHVHGLGREFEHRASIAIRLLGESLRSNYNLQKVWARADLQRRTTMAISVMQASSPSPAGWSSPWQPVSANSCKRTRAVARTAFSSQATRPGAPSPHCYTPTCSPPAPPSDPSSAR